jgi:probable rRNA maturation factor
MPKAQSSIQFYSADIEVPLKERKKIKQFLKSQFARSGRRLQKLDYIFCSDSYLLEMNIRFLQHDTLTDIITFPLHDVGEPISGEIYISVERVSENADALKLPKQLELLRVIFHGALHLLGYKDKSKADGLKMRGLEEAWLKEFELFHVEQ